MAAAKNPPAYLAGKPEYTMVAVKTRAGWSSICPELDVASTGRSADEALGNLYQAITEVFVIAREQGLVAGHPLGWVQARTDAENEAAYQALLLEFINSHDRTEPVLSTTYSKFV